MKFHPVFPAVIVAVVILITTLSVLIKSGSPTTRFSPSKVPAAPLAVRSPYLSTWLYSNNSEVILPGSWPTFWKYVQNRELLSCTVLIIASDAITGWQGLVRVDGKTYNWMGGAFGPIHATQTAFSYTTMRSIFEIQAGPVQLTVGFLSPIYPTDFVRQSISSSYLEVSVKSTDGKEHVVQIYADVSGGQLLENLIMEKKKLKV